MVYNYLPIGGLLACFAILVGAMFITSRVPAWVRAGAAAIAVLFAIAIWLNTTALFGFPVDAEPVTPGRVVSLISDKPHGFIYAWVDEANGPRAYQMPYNSKEGQELLKAMKKAGETGGMVVIRGKGGSGRDKGQQKGNNRLNGDGNSSIQGDDTLEVEIDVVPLLPQKD